jgi:hypothetical protein
MLTSSEWAAGRECDKHEMSYCADCRDTAGIRRDADGTVGYTKDCAVQTFVEITGADYEEAAGYLRAAGFRPSSGTPAATGLRDALTAAGYSVREVTGAVRYDDLAHLPGSYYISGRRGSRGHAWSVIDGTPRRAYGGRFTYRVFEVTA